MCFIPFTTVICTSFISYHFYFEFRGINIIWIIVSFRYLNIMYLNIILMHYTLHHRLKVALL